LGHLAPLGLLAFFAVAPLASAASTAQPKRDGTTFGCVVRFDAFQDTAGQQSFAVALLDNRGNGVVITSLFGRSESRCYAKPVVKGESPFPLSDEERAAIRQALEQPVGVQEATSRHAP
jgi:hypothetical protein